MKSKHQKTTHPTSIVLPTENKLSFTVLGLLVTDHKKSYMKPVTQNLRNEHCVPSTHEADPHENCSHELLGEVYIPPPF